MLSLIAGALYASALLIVARREDRFGGAPWAALLTCGLTAMRPVWRGTESLVRRLSPGETPAFDRRRSTHRAAAILALLFWAWLLLSATQAPATSVIGPAERLLGLLALTAVYLSVAALGVGWRTERDWRAVLRRLGIRAPGRFDWLAGVCGGIGLFMAASLATALWESAVSPGLFELQTARARDIFESFSGTLLAGASLAFLSALGEETLFRGALQPVFGIPLTAGLFAATHMQYAFTPALLIIFVAGSGFGILRLRLGTGAAIIAHAVYNFIPFMFNILTNQAG